MERLLAVEGEEKVVEVEVEVMEEEVALVEVPERAPKMSP